MQNLAQKSKLAFLKKRVEGFTLIELLVVIAIIGILAGLIILGFNSVRKKARDAQRKSDLKQLQLALEEYFGQTESYPTGAFFSVWDYNYGHTTYYWSGGNPPWSTAFYDALVGNGYVPRLPLDPTNREGGAGNFLGDGPPTDLSYVYYSASGTSYILGTNLETGGVAPNWLGNYQITNIAQ